MFIITIMPRPPQRYERTKRSGGQRRNVMYPPPVSGLRRLDLCTRPKYSQFPRRPLLRYCRIPMLQSHLMRSRLRPIASPAILPWWLGTESHARSARRHLHRIESNQCLIWKTTPQSSPGLRLLPQVLRLHAFRPNTTNRDLMFQYEACQTNLYI